MKIAVCIKRVPDTEARIRIAGSRTEIDAAGIKFIISPYDEFAVEAALRLKDASPDTEVVLLSVSEGAAAEQLRAGLALGADRAVLLRGPTTSDGLATARALAARLQAESPDLVLFGMKAADDDQQQVGAMTAELLGLPCVTSVASFEVSGGAVVAEREVDGGVEVVDAPVPVVLTITKGRYEPRYASLKGIMAAKKKPLEEVDAQPGASRIRVLELSPPPDRPPGRVVGQGADAVPELVRLLREEAKVL